MVQDGTIHRSSGSRVMVRRWRHDHGTAGSGGMGCAGRRRRLRCGSDYMAAVGGGPRGRDSAVIAGVMAEQWTAVDTLRR